MRRRGMFDLGGGAVKTASQTAFVLVGFCTLTACAPRVPETFDTHYQRAVEHYQAGRPTAAIAEYRDALSLRPDSAEAHNNLGAALYDVGQRDAAMQEYRQALRLNPASAEAHNNLGVALLEAQQFAAAVGEYRRAVELQPEFTAAQYNLCLGLELLGQLRDALTQCQIAAQQDPGRPGVTDAVERLRNKLAEQ
jgi:Tfp pilus assembly protein PilF